MHTLKQADVEIIQDDHVPEITTLDAFVRLLSDGCASHVSVTDRDGFSVVCYNSPAVRFTNRADRECRGLVFDTGTGLIIRRPFEKFFNVGERSDTTLGSLSGTGVVSAADKLDGTMLAPFRHPVSGDIYYGTKRCSADFNQFIQSSGIVSPDIETFVASVLDAGCSPIFEYHDPAYASSCIVIRYGARFMRLLAVRTNSTGAYVDPAQFHGYENIQCADSVHFNTVAEAVHAVDTLDGAEGYVLLLDTGDRVKIKTQWYLKRHRLTDTFSTPWLMHRLCLDAYAASVSTGAVALPELTTTDIIRVSFNGHGDDVLPTVSPEQHAVLEKHREIFVARVHNMLSAISRSLRQHSTPSELGRADNFNGRDCAFRIMHGTLSTNNALAHILQHVLPKYHNSNAAFVKYAEHAISHVI